MKPLCSRLLIAGLFVLFTLSITSGKASLSKLLISGGKLPEPVEIIDPKLLRASNPWGGTFIAQWNQDSLTPVGNPDDAAPRYELAFYAQFSDKEPGHIIYIAYYAFDAVSNHGFIYLPGPHEQWYHTNMGTIIRPRQDGRWSVADPAWCDQVNAIIARANETPETPTH